MKLIIDKDFFNSPGIIKEDYASGVILPDGSYKRVIESHLHTLFLLTGKTEEEIWEMIPKDDSPLFFMIAYTRCAITDTVSTVGLTMTPQQEETYHFLIENGIIEDKFFDITNERKKKKEL